ncbi:phosphotransferase enzyme family protein [Fusarium austroafricanum]|uniref:Phosphotransferase enzyme family protein n=1 Tax=Fusarium austroafricanum TaxID=2364996 RepID=A0A8H4KCJ7_9HYPO|nr:phosphotransferase enzyme family protein [Fusarium austroafricanum]
MFGHVSAKLPYFRNAAELPGPLPTLSEIHNSPEPQLSPRRTGLSSPGGVTVIRGIYVVKYGKRVTEYEGNALIFVEKHLRIGAPRLCAMFRDEPSGCLYLIMEYIQGVNLESIWSTLSVESKSSITMQLKDMFDQMRTLEPPKNFIGGIDAGALRDTPFQTMEPDPRINGPFQSSEEVGMALALASRNFWEETGRTTWLPRFFTQHLGAALKDHQASFTHGDLRMRNIVVEKVLETSSPENSDVNEGGAKQHYEYRVRGIVDWESAGWYPAYWEYTSALARAHQESDWPERVGEMMKPYPLELSMIFLVFQDLQVIY